MLKTIRHNDTGKLVVAAKLLTCYVTVKAKVEDPPTFLRLHETYDADYVAFVCSWQSNHGLTPDGVIGPETWTAITRLAPTCSTSRNRISGYTLALQYIVDSSLIADAIFGPRTKAAVVAFQTAKGLAVDGICGPKTWSALIVGMAEGMTTPTHAEAVKAGTFVQPTDFKQGDKRWGSKMYSNHGDKGQTMANSGCGPTSAADIINFCNDPNVDPYDLAKKSMAWGDRTDNSGTAWTFFPHLQAEYGYEKMIATKSVETLKACLDAGGYAVASMGKGYWTSKGHFITPWKYTLDYVYCNDPASSSRKRQKWSDFQKERKQFFCFFPNAPQAPEDNGSGGTGGTEPPVTRGDKICDVARSQGNINWDLLAPELAFVVIKASGLYRNGADTQYANNVKGAVSHGVPWHTYTYLYCKTSAEVKRDAKLYFDTVSSGGHWPLFWCLDLEAGWGAPNKDVPMLAEDFEGELRRLCKEQGPGEIKISAYVAQEKYYDWSLDYDHYAYLWIPGYGEKNRPPMPCDIWQYTSTGKLPGIKGNVDLDVLMGRKPLAFFTDPH